MNKASTENHLQKVYKTFLPPIRSSNLVRRLSEIHQRLICSGSRRYSAHTFFFSSLAVLLHYFGELCTFSVI